MLQLLGEVGDRFDESSLRDLMGRPGNVLLIQSMEIYEAIVEAGADQKALRNLLNKNSHRIDDVCGQLASALEAHQLDKAVELTVKLQYYN